MTFCNCNQYIILILMRVNKQLSNMFFLFYFQIDLNELSNKTLSTNVKFYLYIKKKKT